jgi:hypothetical protein
MGQYYKPCILGKNGKTVVKFLYSWDYNNGLKLMEHSWLTNNFVRAFESLIFKNPQRVVWGGDYADPCSGRKTNTYSRCNDKNNVKPTTTLTDKDCRFVINHSKKLFVDTTKVPQITAKWAQGEDYRIHPLPLLTSNGNLRGGGDFRGEDPNNLVGSWARHLVSVDDTAPVGYKEIEFNLIEA